MINDPRIPHRLFTDYVLEDLKRLIQQARQAGARRLLLLAGKPPICRIGAELSPPLTPETLHFSQMQLLVETILTPNQLVELDKNGALETSLRIGDENFDVNVFFGDASHNVIIFLQD